MKSVSLKKIAKEIGLFLLLFLSGVFGAVFYFPLLALMGFMLFYRGLNGLLGYKRIQVEK